jgi:hypothetical protein
MLRMSKSPGARASRKRRNAGSRKSPAKAIASPRPPQDLAAAAAMLARLRDGGDVRERKARRLRGAVRANRYESELKFQIALRKLLEGIASR